MPARPITTDHAISSEAEDAFEALGSTLAMLQDFAPADNTNVASQHGNLQPSPHKLAAAYAAANSITRRRLDALLREADTVARTGLALILGRGAGSDRATIAAARFLGNSLTGSLRRMENLIASNAA